MGIWFKLKNEAKGNIKIIDPKPLWVGVTYTSSGKKILRLFPKTEEAEHWFKEKPHKRKLYMKTTVAELQRLR